MWIAFIFVCVFYVLSRKSKTKWTTLWKRNRGYKKGQNWKYHTQYLSYTILRGSTWWTETQRPNRWRESRTGYAGIWSGILLKFLSLSSEEETSLLWCLTSDLCSLSLQFGLTLWIILYSLKTNIFQIIYCFRWICMFSNLTSIWKNPMRRSAKVIFWLAAVLLS